MAHSGPATNGNGTQNLSRGHGTQAANESAGEQCIKELEDNAL